MNRSKIAWLIIAAGCLPAQASEVPRIPPPPPVAISIFESSELERILSSWVAATRNIPPAAADFKRFQYDQVFETEKHATGHYTYERPFVFRYEIRSMNYLRDAKGRMKNQAGHPFQLVRDTPEIWIGEGTRIRQLDPTTGDARDYVVPPGASHDPVELTNARPPEGYFGTFAHRVSIAIFQSFRLPMSFALGVSRKDIDERYDWTLLDSADDSIIHLRATPREGTAFAQHLSSVEVLLDSRTFRTQAVKFVDPAKTKETVYVFEEWQPLDRAVSAEAKSPPGPPSPDTDTEPR